MKKTFKKNAINMIELKKFLNKYFENRENKKIEIGASIWTIKNELINRIGTISWLSSESEIEVEALLKSIGRYNFNEKIVIELKESNSTSFMGNVNYNTLNIKYA